MSLPKQPALQKPQFKQHLRVEFVAPETLFLLTETSHQVFSSRAYQHLAPLLNGRHTVGELLILLSGKVAPAELFGALNQLAARGCLADVEAGLPHPEVAYWHSLGADANMVPQRVQQRAVSIAALPGCDAEPLHASLQAVGVGLADTAAAALSVVVTDDYLRPELAALNRQALSDGRRWLPVKLVGNIIWVGPLFEPGATACWACLAQRIENNRHFETFLKRRSAATALGTSRTALQPTMALGANLVATEIMKWIALGTSRSLSDTLLTFDVLKTGSQKHTVVRRPQCPACGDADFLAAYRQPAPIVLDSSAKRWGNDGGHRTLLPEEVHARYEHHISPITGVVSWLVDISGEPNGLTYSYMAGHNFAIGPDNVHWLLQSLRSRTGGKGMTQVQAKVSAIGEAIERYSGVWRGDEPVVRASESSLGAQAVDLRDCLQFSETQYAGRSAWNADPRSGHFHTVPNPLETHQTMDWTALWSLTRDEWRYLPAAYCYYGHPEATEPFVCMSNSNGCASGNTMAEAVLQGFLELVERDSVALWWYNQVQRPAVDLDSFGLPYLRPLRAYYAQLRRELWVLDITADLGIPTFAAVSRRVDRPVEDVIVGFASHLDPKIALLRAVTELNQFLPAVINTAPDGSTRYSFPDGEAVEWWQTATIAQQRYLVPDPALPPRRLSDYPHLTSDDVRDDVRACVDIAGRAGLEVLVLDQTRPDIEMPVCRVVVPGLRHFWRRLGPGRLYDVPVELGWVATPASEADLNPRSVFF